MRTLIVPDVNPSSSIRRRWLTPPASPIRTSVTSAPKLAGPRPCAANTSWSSRSMWPRTRPSRETTATGEKSSSGRCSCQDASSASTESCIPSQYRSFQLLGFKL